MEFSIQPPSVRYEIQECIGYGASADVYRCLKTDSILGLQQVVAIKVLKSEILVDVWKREFTSLSLIRSKYCVQIFGFECWQDRPALILEYVDGVSLAELESLGDDEIREILRQVQCGLEDLHQQGLFHGDLSLRNILVDRLGRVRLLDFGLGNVHAEGNCATPEFAAPEVLQGATPTLSSDLYSLARVEQFLRQESRPTQLLLFKNLTDRHQDRVVIPLIESTSAQASLALKVRQLRLAAQVRSSGTVNLPKASSWASVAVFVLTVGMLAMTPHGESHPAKNFVNEPQPSFVSVRTKNWYQVEISGRDAGFSPISNFKIPPGLVQVRWRNARAHGQRALTLSPGQNKVLDDSFFSR